MLTEEAKDQIILTGTDRRSSNRSDHVLYAWKMDGADDVKIIAALNDEYAARIAVQARIDNCDQTEQEALKYVAQRDSLRRIDPEVFFQGEAAVWDGDGKIGWAVEKV